MLRYLLLGTFVAFLCTYAWKDWYRSLCGLVVMMAVSERYDMPRSMFGILGLNPWNFVFLFVVLAWFANKRKEGLKWDMPPHLNRLLIAYLIVILLAVFRTYQNTGQLVAITTESGIPLPVGFSLVAESIMNSIKFAIPGLLFYHGCNSKERFWWGAGAILLCTFALSLQIIKWMPLSVIADADALQKAALRLLDRNIGYHRVDLAALMASSAWAFFLVANSIDKKSLRIAARGCALISTFALLLTAGRTGYATWMIIGMFVAAIKYRRMLFVLPIVLVVAVMAVPAAQDRLFEGFGDSSSGSTYDGGGAIDFEAVTSDRSLVWPTVIEKIQERPITGYGRYGFFLSGAQQEIVDIHGQAGAFPHPHNAYFELLLDSGLIGALPIMAFFFIAFRRSLRLLRCDTDTLVAFAGLLGLSFVLGQLLASIGSQSFYPRQGVVTMWCAIGLMFRVHNEYLRNGGPQESGVNNPVKND